MEKLGIKFFQNETNKFVTADSTAEEYFQYLMSSHAATIELDREKRIVPDLKASMFMGVGITALGENEIAFGPTNNAWHVAIIGSGDDSEMPFLITRNVKPGTVKYPRDEDLANPDASPLIQLGKFKPFETKQAVWLNKGGSTFHARPRILRTAWVVPVVQPDGAGGLRFFKSIGGAQE